MAFQRDPEAGRKAVAWLAVAFTLTTGTLVCTFIVLAFAEQRRDGLLVLGGILASILFLLWFISSPRESNSLRGWLSFLRGMNQEPDPAELYQPRRRRRKDRPLGANQPPTADTVREIADLHARWVPQGPHPGKKRPKRP